MPKKGWRTCRHCKKAKALRAFAPTPGRIYGGGQARASYICLACRAKAAKKRERLIAHWKHYGRDCRECGERRKCPDEIGIANNATCISCQRRIRGQNARRRYALDPEFFRTQCRIWRTTHPDAAAEARRRWRERVEREAPERIQQMRDEKRFLDRMRRHERGLVPDAEPPAMPGGDLLSVAPLLVALGRYLERVRWMHGEDATEGEALEQLGIDPRSFYDWSRGIRRSVHFDYVDSIMVHAGWNWFDVYEKPANGHKSGRPEDVLRYIADAEAYIAASLAFEGELVE
jgi:hypothetical protein